MSIPTEAVWAAYVYELVKGGNEWQYSAERDEEFDRWLKEYTAQKQAEAWSACVDHLEPVLGTEVKRAAHADNPYNEKE